MTNEFLSQDEVSEAALVVSVLRLVLAGVKAVGEMRRRRREREGGVPPS